MTIMKSITSVLTILLLSFTIALSVQAQPQPSRVNARQVGNLLQRLERSSTRFRKSLNLTLVQRSVDQTQPQNDVSTLESDYQLAIKQFRDQFTRRLAVAADVESIMEKAWPISSFVTRHTLNPQVKNVWTSVLSDLKALGSAYGVSWPWKPLTQTKIDGNRSVLLSESELNLLIQRLENNGDTFRVSLTDAFFQRPYDRTRSEGKMNDALRSFKKATDQVRIRFDARELVADDVRSLLERAKPLDDFMREHSLTDRAMSDWSTLRNELNTLGSAYGVAPFGRG